MAGCPVRCTWRSAEYTAQFGTAFQPAHFSSQCFRRGDGWVSSAVYMAFCRVHRAVRHCLSACALFEPVFSPRRWLGVQCGVHGVLPSTPRSSALPFSLRTFRASVFAATMAGCPVRCTWRSAEYTAQFGTAFQPAHFSSQCCFRRDESWVSSAVYM